MPQRDRSTVPLESHRTETLNLVYVVDDVRAFVCKTCTPQGETRESSTVKTTHNASNLYSHVKLLRNNIFALIEPTISSRDKNKRAKVSTTIEESLANSEVRKFNNALLSLFSVSDLPKSLISTKNLRQFCIPYAQF